MSRQLRDYESTPFGRLAVAQAASVVGDACLTVALAGSIFFSLSPGAARPKVLLYLLLTVAPFAVVKSSKAHITLVTSWRCGRGTG